MAALLIAMSIMAILLTVAMPVWKQTAQREKEEELVFRGLQYAHAIGLFQRKFANAYPPSVDALVEQRFLRKKFKDPITNDDFAIIPAGATVPGAGQGNTAPGRGATGTPAASSGGGTQSPGPGRGNAVTQPQTVAAGISGVTSKSKAQSIRLYNGRSHYNEWAFIHVATVQQPGAGAPGSGAPGQTGRGQQGQPPGAQGPLGGQRGRGAPNGPGGRGFGPNGPGGPGGPGAPGAPRGGFGNPGAPNQPILPGRGRL
jgi:type II secretory pathway pseudopilin PulG